MTDLQVSIGTDAPLPNNVQQQLKRMTSIAEQELIASNRSYFTPHNLRKYWNGMGHSAQVGRIGNEIALLRRVVTSTSHGPMQTVCEVGMNAGHSATALLEGLSTTLIEFDMFAFPYSNAVRNELSKRNPGRTRFFQGNSFKEIPRYASNRVDLGLPLCDAWFVDGDHEAGANLDLRHALNVSRDGAIIIADDCSSKHKKVQNAWRSLINEGHIREHWNVSGSMKGWCVGRFERDEARVASSNIEVVGRRRRLPPIEGFTKHYVQGHNYWNQSGQALSH